MGDETRTALEGTEETGPITSVEVSVAGRPPTRQGDPDAEQVRRRDALLTAVRAALTDAFASWTTPVHIEIRVESGPDGDPSASSGDVLAAVIETLARQRPDRLASPHLAAVSLYPHRGLVREARCLDIWTPELSYVVRVTRMANEQVAAISDASGWAEFGEALQRGDIDPLAWL